MEQTNVEQGGATALARMDVFEAIRTRRRLGAFGQELTRWIGWDVDSN